VRRPTPSNCVFIQPRSIFIGLISSRIGAPLLLALLGLGIFFGEDGPTGILFNNYFAAYTIGSVALAIIFNGGLRTEFGNFRVAAWPSFLPATVGVALTAALTGVAAQLLLGLGWIESMLIARSSAQPTRRRCSSCGSDVDVAHAVEPGEREQER
jgi:NhaP-type Na+/H+ and K+/H+ antiporter